MAKISINMTGFMIDLRQVYIINIYIYLDTLDLMSASINYEIIK